jgi:hypothetical protein
MNVYTHTDLAEKACAIAKLPSFEKHPAATSVLDSPASRQSDGQQRFSSSPVTEIDNQQQSLSTVEKKDDRRALKSSGRKALPEKALSADDEECHRISEVHLDGLEPSTFGSVDRLETLENRNILRGFDAFLNLTPLQIIAKISTNFKAFLYYRLRFSVVVFSLWHRLNRPTTYHRNGIFHNHKCVEVRSKVLAKLGAGFTEKMVSR